MSHDPALITGRLNVDDFVAARKDDIRKLESSLELSGSGVKKRAFQSLPRIERRRAASHHPKRLPRKNGLRKIAELEAIRDNSLITKKRIRKIKQQSDDHSPLDLSSYNELSSFPTDLKGKYANRQKDKIWLPTHIWHKKRSFLQSVCGIEIPITATQKQYRRTYRLTSHVEERGAMAWDSSFYATIVARPKDGVASSALIDVLREMFPGSTSTIYIQGQKHWQGLYRTKSLCNEMCEHSEGPALLHWIEGQYAAIQCHPLLFTVIWKNLKVFENVIDIEDCRYAVGCIDITGPRALDVLRSLVYGIQTHNRHNEDELALVFNSKVVPHRFVKLFNVSDPRGRNSNIKKISASVGGGVFSKNNRQLSFESGAPKNICADVSKPNIPVCIYSLDDGRLRLVLPRAWVLPFWLEIFAHRNSVLIGGQKELHQLAFESGSPYYPIDYVHTSEGLSSYLNQCKTGLNHLRTHLPTRKRDKVGLSTELMEFLAKSDRAALRHVVIKPISKGVPLPGASIQDNKGEIIGIVTTGNFSLSEAKGFGIGVIREPFDDKTEYSVSNPNSSKLIKAAVRGTADSNLSIVL